MVRDPLYRQILARLDDQLDPDVFELFAVEIVRQDLPTAVPIVGGSDAGLDGSVASLDGPQVPIIATTSDRVLDNVRKNLKTYESEWKARGARVVVVTSALLTPRRRKHVADEVASLGFRLVQLYERYAIAERLYHAPRWRIELLGLPGDPPILSQVAPRPVASPGVSLVGRDEDLAWLAATSGDRLLFGSPACGKTALLEEFARRHSAFFVTPADRCQVADGVRELRPKILIVDDAHTTPGVLDDVVWVRSSTGATFDIIATAWTGFHEVVQERLGLTSPRVRELRPLERFEVADVVKSLGLAGPDWLVRSVLDQAAGRIGLAVSLARVCLLGERNDVREVVLGGALLRYVKSLEDRIGTPLEALFAPFAVGGEDGLVLEDVADALRHSALELRDTLARVGSTGFIRLLRGWEGQQRIVVEPPTLREAAVRAVFFDRAPRLEIAPFLKLVTRPCSVASTLVGACHQGGSVPRSLVRDWVSRCDDVGVWEAYAYLGAAEAVWVHENRPDLLVNVQGALLAHIPDRTIPALLNVAMDDQRELHSHPDHGLRILHDWVKAAQPGTGMSLVRRRALIEATVEWEAHTLSKCQLAQRALFLALDPEFERSSLDPVHESSITLWRGVLDTTELVDLLGLWKRAFAFLREAPSIEWGYLLEHAGRWIFLGGSTGVPPGVTEAVKPGVQKMIDDMVLLAQGRPGVLAELRHHMRSRQYDYKGPTDAVFDTLFPDLEQALNNESQVVLLQNARQLGRELSLQEPSEVLSEIERCLLEAHLAGRTYPDMTDVTIETVADKVANPKHWLDEAKKSALPQRHLVILVRRLSQRQLSEPQQA